MKGENCMKKLINESQKEEIVEMSRNHKEALVAYGSDLYSQGLTKGFGKGFKLAVGIWATSFVIGYTIGMVKFVRKKA